MKSRKTGKKEAIRRLKLLADRLDNYVTDDQFNMDLFIEHDEREPVNDDDPFKQEDDVTYTHAMKDLKKLKCNTVGCIAGHTVAMFATKDDIRKEFDFVDLGGKLLGLERQKAYELFHSFNLDRHGAAAELRRIADEIKPR